MNLISGTTESKYLTYEEIAEQVGISIQAVAKRKDISDYYIGRSSTKGRSKLLFKPEVLNLWRPANSAAIERMQIEESGLTKVRKKRDDQGKPRTDIPLELLTGIIELTRQKYLAQARRDNIYECCREAIEEFMQLEPIFNDYVNFKGFERVAKYIYHKQIMRSDANGTGACHTEKWYSQWESIFDVNRFNGKMPQNSWDYCSYFLSMGLAGENNGAGKLWIMDATQFDSWLIVPEHNAPTTLNFFQICDGLTGFPLFVFLLEKGESIQAANQAIMRCVERYGAPEYGIMFDNSSTFKSDKVKQFVKSLYTDEQLEGIKSMQWRKRIFGGQDEPYLFPLPKIPRFPFKSVIERSFREVNRFASKFLPLSYQGGRESLVVQYGLGTMPTTQLKNAPHFDEAWTGLLGWLYTDYVNKLTAGKLSNVMRRNGKRSDRLNAFQYFGGILEFDNGTIRLSRKNIPELNANNIPSQVYYLAEPTSRHYITVSGFGQVKVTHENAEYNYHSQQLDYRYINEKICVVPHPGNPEKAYLFKEYDNRRFSELTPTAGSLYYIGEAYDATIRREGDEQLIARRKANQKHQEAVMAQEWGEKIPVVNRLEPKRLEYAEYKEVIEEPIRIKALPEPELEVSDDDINDFFQQL